MLFWFWKSRQREQAPALRSQTSFEHIIRDREDYEEIVKYIIWKDCRATAIIARRPIFIFIDWPICNYAKPHPCCFDFGNRGGASPRPTITNTVWVFLRQEHHALRFRGVIIQNINLFLYVLSFVLSCSELNRKSFLFLQCSALSPKTYIYLRGTQCSDDAQNGSSVLQLCEECCFLSCGR